MTETADVQKTALRSLIEEQEKAWNRGDAVAWCAPFTDDAAFISLRGDAVRGRELIENNHRMIFSGVYKDSHDTVSVEGITFPVPGVAFIDVLHEITNYATLPPGVAATEPGVLRARMRFVAVQQDGTWRFTAAQNTAVFPRPAVAPTVAAPAKP